MHCSTTLDADNGLTVAMTVSPGFGENLRFDERNGVRIKLIWSPVF
jgi:hypothetical protein